MERCMKTFAMSLVGLFVVLFFTALSAQTQAPTLSAEQQLQLANHNLKVQVAECQQQLSQVSLSNAQTYLTNERTTLEKSFRDTLKPADGATFNWQTGVFDAPAKKP